MGSRSLLLFILVIGMLAVGIYMTTRVYVPQVSTLPSTVADSAGTTTPGTLPGASPATVDRARQDMKAMQDAARAAERKSRPGQ